eukprot:GSChrysophyteH2.ASY1.ANO1.1721.1 assembled CDS
MEEFRNISKSDDVKWPGWMKEMCPEVIDHFMKFPYFESFGDIPIMTTETAALSVCTMKFVARIAASTGFNAYTYAGSDLGGFLHAGPIPWDDDVDMAMHLDGKDLMIHAIRKYSLSRTMGPELVVIEARNALKIYFDCKQLSRIIPKLATRKDIETYKWPFVDLFMLKFADGIVQEVAPSDGPSFGLIVEKKQQFLKDDFFPVQHRYFGGIYLPSPNLKVAARRYSFEKCFGASYKHRLEESFSLHSPQISCCKMKKHFLFYKSPCVYEYNNVEHRFCSDINSNSFPVSYLDARMRQSLDETKTTEMSLKKLTRSNIDEVELINTASHDISIASLKSIRVVEANLGRGRRISMWVDELRKLDPDVIIVNEADITMTRSDNQHIVRNMASLLHMNYAWGVEYVELSKGTKREHAETKGIEDTKFLHGNAILSKFNLSEPKIYRDDMDNEFSKHANLINADAFERRMGGRMGMLVKINDTNIILGTVHKVHSHDSSIAKYIGLRKAIVGGNQPFRSCAAWGLQVASNISTPTWKATCNSYGSSRGGILCTNIPHRKNEIVALPCSKFAGINVPLGDHAFITQDFLLHE